MKKPNFLPVIIGLSLFFIGLIISAMIWHNWDLGSREERDFIAKDFDKVKIETIGKIYISQGEDEGVTIKAPEKIFERLDVEVRNQELAVQEQDYWHIGFYDWKLWRHSREVEIFINVKDLDEIQLNGAADVFVENGFQADTLRVRVDGAGDIDLDLDVQKLICEINGAGDVDIEGAVQEQKLEIDGAGDIDSSSVKSQEVSLEINGAGDIKVWAEEILDVTINGAGDVRYKGNPKITKEIDGAGDVERID